MAMDYDAMLTNKLLGSQGRGKLDENQTEPEAKKESAEPPRIADTCLSIALFLLLFMLVANVSVLISAQCLNEAACRAAITWAKRGVIEGHRPEAVMRLASIGVESSTPTSFLVSHPEFIEFKDGYKNGKRAIRVRTRALAKMPAPFLMPNAPFNQNGQLSVSRTYELEIAPEPGPEHKAGSK